MSTQTLTERSAMMALCAAYAASPLDPAQSRAMHQAISERGAIAVWKHLLDSVEADDSPQLLRIHEIVPNKLAEDTEAAGARFVWRGDFEWPDRIESLNYPLTPGTAMRGAPLGLWVRGNFNLAELGDRGIAIIGARAATSYGTTVATEWAGDLANMDKVIISGMAFGTDAAAHRGALLQRKPTLAVLASGVDVPYPVANTSLMQAIVDNGAVVSESPCGTIPTKSKFVNRNRIIAALAGPSVVVEAAVRSGSRHELEFAAEMGRPRFAVPGAVTSSMSMLPNLMIAEGLATAAVRAARIVADEAAWQTLGDPNA